MAWVFLTLKPQLPVSGPSLIQMLECVQRQQVSASSSSKSGVGLKLSARILAGHKKNVPSCERTLMSELT